MAVTYTYQNRATLQTIARNLILSVDDSNPIFKYVFPTQERNTIKLRWQQDGNYRGMMALRGLGGPPTPIKTYGGDVFETEPAVFGEFATINEQEMALLSAGVPQDSMIAVSVDERVAELQATLLAHQQNRMRAMGWTIARTGAISIPLPNGGIGYTENYTIPSLTVDVPWDTYATATPLKDLMSLVPTYTRGTSNDFGYRATILLNSKTMKDFYLNANAADYAGRTNSNGGSFVAMQEYDRIRQGYNLPEFVVWDGGYLAEDNTYTLDIPDDELLIVAGRPDGATPGEFSITRNEITKSPTPYTAIKDYSKAGPNGPEIPPRIEVHAGFNGGAVLHRPSQLLRVIVG